jgi:hypothetical protein
LARHAPSLGDGVQVALHPRPKADTIGIGCL